MLFNHKLFFALFLSFLSCSINFGIPNAGVLPYAKKDDQIYFLFGLENRFQDAHKPWVKKAGTTLVWADFGGTCDAVDATDAPQYNTDQATLCAAREAAEETRYVFGNKLPLRSGLNKSSNEFKKSVRYFINQMKISFKINGYYEQFFAEVDYINANTIKNSPKVPNYEKDDYIWVTLNDLIATLQSPDTNGFSKIGQTIIFPTLAKTLRRSDVQQYMITLVPSAQAEYLDELFLNLTILHHQLLNLLAILQTLT